MVGLAALLSVGCAQKEPATTRAPEVSKPAPVRVGYLPIAAELPLFVALEKGYFRDENVDVALTRFTSSNELGTAISAGSIDVAAGTALNVAFDIGSVSGKHELLFVVNPYSNAPGHVTDHLIVRTDSKIQSLTQLRGKRVASFPGSVNRIFTELILEKHGVRRGDYQYLELTPPNWQPALASGSVDAVSALEPQASQILQDGVGRSIFPGFYADLMPDVPLSGHWLAAAFVQKDRARAERIVRAYDRAVLFCRQHEVDAKRYLTKYAGVRSDTLARVNLNPWKLRREIDVGHVQQYADLLAANNGIQKHVDVATFLLPQ
jgi:NitT/TauT family transport system substrate-binding protein